MTTQEMEKKKSEKQCKMEMLKEMEKNLSTKIDLFCIERERIVWLSHGRGSFSVIFKQRKKSFFL